MSSSQIPLSRRRFLIAAGATGAAAGAGLLRPGRALATTGPQSYTASWASVDQHPPAPTWFQDAKFGIYFHFGVFSVPAYGDEWYPRRMYDPGDACNTHHIATYGEPSVWPYNNFIDGARDKAGNYVQFAPKLASAGGNFDPDAWAALFAKAGAKFAGPVAEHHDGFAMWNSTVNEWNSVKHGPKLDLVGLHATAIRAQGLKFMVSLHTAYNFNGYYQYAPQQSTATLQKLFGQLSTTAENQLWYAELNEVIQGYQPDLIYQDFDLSMVEESYRLEFLADYYNAAVGWNKDVVATYKDGFDLSGEVFDYERGGPGSVLTPYWETDDAISADTWCYVQGMSYYSTQALLDSFIDRVSKGGTQLLNISPEADGTIPAAQQSILLGFGDWLGRFGESIYSTRAWTVNGEGPTKMGGGTFTGDKAGTAQDIRFTRNQASTVLYAIAMGWPGATMTIQTLNSSQFSISDLTSAQLIDNAAGKYANLPKPTQDGSGLHLSMPSASAPFSAYAYVVKLTFSGQIPVLGAGGGGGIPAGWAKVANAGTGLVLDSGGKVASGTDLGQWTYNGSTNLQWQFVSLGGGYYRIVNNTNGMVADSWGDTANGAPARQAAWNGGNNQQWSLQSAGSGRYHIVNRGSGTALDGAGATTNGSVTELWASNSSLSNEYTITAV